MDILKENGFTTSCVGKISDIFNGAGVTETTKTISNVDGMNKTLAIAKDKDFSGLCFVNLVEFDSEYGHRRDPIGYAKAIETFDAQLKELLSVLHDDDLIMVTADHGNDPTHTGTDHTREKVPLLVYNARFQHGKKLDERTSFADIGVTILKNFKLKKTPNQIGKPIEELLKD